MRGRMLAVAGSAGLVLAAGPAWACGGLVGDNGTLALGRTTTLAAYVDGVEHYITGFEFAGSGGEFGSIVPLPDVPTKVEKAGEWTLQRLLLEVQPPVRELAFASAGDADSPAPAEVILEAEVDSLDVTVLKGGATAVGNWAREHGFGLSPDAPEVLDFYAKRSPIFMAVRFNAERAEDQGVELGQATPIQVTIPTDSPWVPLRILALGKDAAEPVEADVFMLTERRPTYLPHTKGLSLERSERASSLLLEDLRGDDRMGWLPESGMHLSYLQLSTTAGELTYDLAVDASGTADPSEIDAGLAPVEVAVPMGAAARAAWVTAILLAAATATGIAMARRQQA